MSTLILPHGCSTNHFRPADHGSFSFSHACVLMLQSFQTLLTQSPDSSPPAPHPCFIHSLAPQCKNFPVCDVHTEPSLKENCWLCSCSTNGLSEEVCFFHLQPELGPFRACFLCNGSVSLQLCIIIFEWGKRVDYVLELHDSANKKFKYDPTSSFLMKLYHNNCFWASTRQLSSTAQFISLLNIKPC